MNSFKQQKSFSVGSDADIRSLAEKKEATLLVLSDSHGQKLLVRKLLGDFGQKCDAVVFCGDGISDILSALDDAYDNSAYAASISPIIAFVQGNGDSNRYPVKFNPESKKRKSSFYHEIDIPKRIILRVAGYNIFVVHGHNEGVYYNTDLLQEEAKIAGARIALYGHSHIAKEENRNGLHLLNPGSCSHPRCGLPPSVATMTVNATDDSVEIVFYRISYENTGKLTYTPFQPPPVQLW